MKIIRILKTIGFAFFQSTVNNLPVWCPYWMRHAMIKNILGIKLGPQSTIAAHVFITGNQITIGRNSIVNRFAYLDGRYALDIGNNVNISHYVIIHTLTHDLNSSSFQAVGRKVTIEDDVWIGVRAIILPGVRVGRGAVVGAGAVVTKDVPAYSVVAGVPAAVIGERARDLKYRSTYRPLFDTDIQI